MPWPASDFQGRPDIIIRHGEVPPALESPVDGGCGWQTAPNAFLIGMGFTARCLILDGGRLIHIALGQDGKDSLACLIDSILAACLQMRGVLTMHASAVATAEGAVLIAGNVATGKSTLAAALVDRGYRLLADGIVGIAPGSDGMPLAQAGFPIMNLWALAMNTLDKSWREATGKPSRSGIVRYPVPARHFCGDPLALRAVYVLRSFHGTEDIVKPLSLPQAFSALLNCTFRLRFLKGLKQDGVHFRTTTTLAKQTPVYYLRRPGAVRMTPTALADQVIGHLGVRHEFCGKPRP